MTTDTSSRAQALRLQAIAGGWTEQQLAEAIREQCAVTLLRAHRFARSWTLQHVVDELRQICRSVSGVEPALSHQRVSRWETGADMPSQRYLDALCRLYRTRPDRLGFGRDHSDDAAALGESRPVQAPTAASVDGVDGRYVPEGVDGEEGEEMKRRLLLRSLVGFGGIAESAQLFDALRTVRVAADALLETQSVSASTVDRWEMVAHEYGYLHLTTPPYEFLAQVMCDFAELRRILSRRQPLEFQKRLYRVMAQLAGLIALTVNAAGGMRETHTWFHTARLAADETGDRALRAWVTANEAMSYLWYGRPIERAVELSRTAQSIAGRNANSAGALAASIEARAQARLGRRQETLTAVQRSEAIFDRLDPMATDGNVLGFYEQRLRFCQGNALTLLGGEAKTAMATQRRAMTISQHDVIDLALVHLDHATCLIDAGDTDEGCRTAREALLALPQESRRGVVLFRAREIAGMVVPGEGRLGAVRDLQEVIRLCRLPS